MTQSDDLLRGIREKILSGVLPKQDCRMTWYGGGISPQPGAAPPARLPPSHSAGAVLGMRPADSLSCRTVERFRAEGHRRLRLRSSPL
jgi:hypothetical protein